jgi:peptide/nickel transport system permease protein
MDRRKLRVLLRHRGAMAGAALLVAVVLVSLGGTFLSPHDPSGVVEGKQAEGPSTEHWLGRDHFGRDIMTRLSVAAWLSLVIGLVAVAFSATLGVALGSVAGYFGGWIDGIVMRGIDVMMAFPRILLAILIAAVLGRGMDSVVIAVGITGIPAYARQVRGSVLVIREMEYVAASRALGSGPWRTLLRHVLPNTLGPIVVLATLGMGAAILEAAGLSFLGLGVEPDQPEWGAMLYQGRLDFRESPWLAITSGMAITLTVLSFNLFGDGLRDAIDPRSRA